MVWASPIGGALLFLRLASKSVHIKAQNRLYRLRIVIWVHSWDFIVFMRIVGALNRGLNWWEWWAFYAVVG